MALIPFASCAVGFLWLRVKTHDDVVGRGAYATPEREVGLFVGASVVPNLDPVGNVDEDAWLELPNNDPGARSVVVVCRSWTEVVPALRD